MKEDARIIRPLSVVMFHTIEQTVATVEDLIGLVVDKADTRGPIISLLGSFEVSLVISESSEASSNIEKATIRDRVLVMVAVVERKDLPSQTSTAGIVGPAMGLRVEDTLGQSEPLGFFVRRVWEADFSSY